MLEKNSYKTKVNGGELKVEVGTLAEQASGSALVQFAQTTILVTAQLGRERPDMGFFPLTCEFEEKHYAAGKILGSRFIRREGRPSTEATLSARMIDRTIRPLFPEGLTSEIQVIATCLSWDGQNDPDVFGIVGASLALSVSEIPWQGPVGAVRVGRVQGKLILNPTYEQREQGDLDIVLAGHRKVSSEGPGKKGEVVVNMIDGKAEEAPEQAMEEMFQFAQKPIEEIIAFQEEIIKELAKEKTVFSQVKIEEKLEKELKKLLAKELAKALYADGKKEYKQGLAELTEKVKALAIDGFSDQQIKPALALLEKEIEKTLKENILTKEKRPDGRKLDEVRGLSTKVGLLPRTHGSGLFQRGQTTVLSILTLGGPGDQLLQETMEVSGKKRFMLHYNFPPYSVGEVKRIGWPGRREIGHGMLAEKALLPLIPESENFPYTIRAVSEVVSSNGSSSMASVSSACLALMDAGVPISAPAAGIALGLVKGKGDDFKILTDIQGPEDHYGDMDFKAAGTEKGLTVLQMDVKGEGVNFEIFKQALERAKKARTEILAVQNKTLKEPRPELSPYAPRIFTLQINPSKIGAVIGTGGKTINEIIEKCGVQIDIEDDGQVFITSEKAEGADKAMAWIKQLTKEVEVGESFEGVVKTITDFGVFVEITPGKDGLVHISQIAPFRLERIEDIIKKGDKIPVKVIGIDELGRIALSAKEAGFSPKPPRPGLSRSPVRGRDRVQPRGRDRQDRSRRPRRY